MERRLSAILAADVVGYSRLMEQDEADTFERLRALRKEILEPEVAARHGRIFKLTGDGLLAEFPSVIDAVECAAVLQTKLAEANLALDEDLRIDVRMGINIGEVIVEGDDRYGEGVNIAARLQELADPGGIWVSAKVAGEVGKKLPFELESVGAHQLKNIEEPIGAFRVKPDKAMNRPRVKRRNPTRGVTRRWAALVAGAAGLAALAGFYLLPTTNTAAEPPAIAVLPFENLSEDSKWDRFADGITEDIITDLARFRDIPVIARTSTEVYRGKAHDMRAIGKALDVQYVLEGSLRIDLHRLRVTAQLINAQSGAHVWSERYDRQAGDFFAVQDEITEKIAATLTGWQSPISQAQKAAARRKSPAELDAYDYWLLGAAEKHKITPASQIEARKLFEKGLAFDPDFQPMVRDLGWTYAIEAWLGAAKDVDFNIRKLDELSARAVELDPQDSLAWQLWSISANWHDDRETQRERIEHALALGPNNADLLVLVAADAAWAGFAERGPELADRALRLNPHHPHFWNATVGPAYFHGGEFAKAYPLARKLGLDLPTLAAYQAMIAAELGKTDEAAEATAALLRVDPEWTAEATFGLPMAKDRELVAESARRAGLPVCMTVAQIEARNPPVRFAECEDERAKVAAVN